MFSPGAESYSPRVGIGQFVQMNGEASASFIQTLELAARDREFCRKRIRYDRFLTFNFLPAVVCYCMMTLFVIFLVKSNITHALQLFTFSL